MQIKQVVLVIILILSLIGFLMPSLFAAEIQTDGSGAVATKPIDPVSNPGILQTNPFYFIKEWSRGVHRVFTFNPVAKLQLDFKVATDKAAELKRLEEIGTVQNADLGGAVANYGESLRLLGARLAATDGSLSAEILSEIIAGISLQQQLLEELKSKHTEISSDIEMAQAYLDGILSAVSEA